MAQNYEVPIGCLPQFPHAAAVIKKQQLERSTQRREDCLGRTESGLRLGRSFYIFLYTGKRKSPAPLAGHRASLALPLCSSC